MAARIPWDKYEAALLLDYCLKVRDGLMSREDAISEISQKLRYRAISNGFAIDDVFRNKNGIGIQMSIIKNCYLGKENGFSASKLFREVVDIKKKDNDAFQRILQEETREMTLYADSFFSLDAIPELTFSKPVSFSFLGEAKEPVKNWSNLYTAVLRRMGAKRIDTLKKCFGNSDFSSDGAKMRRPAEICAGVYTELNFSAIELVMRLKAFFECCEISLDSLVIEYKRNGRITLPSSTTMPEEIHEVIMSRYTNGMRFDDTVLRLLEEKAGIEINETLVNILQKEMFKRSDGLYFLPEMVATQEILSEIRVELLDKLEDYALCEVSCLYENFCVRTSSHCLRGEDDYADFLQYLLPTAIRRATIYGAKIIRQIGVTTNEASTVLSQKLVSAIVKNGCLTEEELLTMCPVISGQFMRKLLEKKADGVVTTVINEVLCYQTIESIGFDESFTETLTTVLNRIGELNLSPSQEVLHALLSVEIGENFREFYGIPDDKTFRRIVAMYYTSKKARAWKAGNFTEE